MEDTQLSQSTALPKGSVGSTAGGSSAFRLPPGWAPEKNEVEITLTEQQPTELALPTDQMDSVKRRLLIAFHAFGPVSIGRIAVFAGLDVKQAKKILDEPEMREAIAKQLIPCWTGAELISRVAVLAETARRDGDRLQAIKMLMEYRSMAAPEGGSRSFKRIAAKFARPVGGEA